MIDIKTIRDNAPKVQKICDERGVDVDISMLLAVDVQRIKLQKEVESSRKEANRVAGSIKSSTPEERETLIMQGAQLKKQTRVIEELLRQLNENYQQLLGAVPNLYAEDTPFGKHDADNVELEVFGDIPKYSFEPKDHIELGKTLGMDFSAGARIAGSGFPLLRGPMALLENAIMRFTQDQAIAHGFIPTNVPLLAKLEVLEGLGFNPRREDDGTEIFSTQLDELCLSGTAEISLVGQFSNETIDTEALPIKLVAMTPCFRREGSYGRRDAGLYRNKMFNKVELVVLTTASESEQALEAIKAFEVDVFKKLGIHFRLIRICAGDLGAPAYMKYDLEGWMMGRSDDGSSAGWGELTSSSNCTDYQARRLRIKHKTKGDKPVFVHTLNGTGITSRAMIPILEQYQNENGSVRVPEALKPYFNGLETLSP